jgi:hypothetical protein
MFLATEIAERLVTLAKDRDHGSLAFIRRPVQSEEVQRK